MFRDFPLAFHQDAQLAHEAAQCAHDQGKFWDFHDALFENQGDLKIDALRKHAVDLGLDMTKFNQCVDGRTHQAAVTAEMQGGGELGVSGTPAFFINGRYLSGAVPFPEFQTIIDDELSRAGG